MYPRGDVAVWCDVVGKHFVEVSKGSGASSAARTTFGARSIYPRGEGCGSNPEGLRDVTEVDQFSRFESVAQRWDVMEPCANRLIMDALVSHLQHGDPEDAPDAAVMKNFETSLIGRREGPVLGPPQKDGQDASLIYHGFRPDLYFWPLPEKAESAHNLGGAENSTIYVGCITKRAVKKGAEIHELWSSGNDTTRVCSKRLCLRECWIRVEKEFMFLGVGELFWFYNDVAIVELSSGSGDGTDGREVAPSST